MKNAMQHIILKKNTVTNNVENGKYQYMIIVKYSKVSYLIISEY